jgi:hypothetical protein
LERTVAWCLLVLTGTALTAAFVSRVVVPAFRTKKRLK